MSPTPITRFEFFGNDKKIIDALTDIKFINASNTALIQAKKRELKAMIQQSLKEMEGRAAEPGWEARLTDIMEKWQEIIDDLCAGCAANAMRISDPLLPGKKE
jgi:hypothetical protein